MTGIPLLRGITVVQPCPFLRYLQRTIPHAGANLLTYYLPKRNRWALAIWKDRTAGIVQEIMSWRSESELTRDKVRFVSYYLSDRRRNDNLRYRTHQAGEERAALREQDDMLRSRRERKRWRESKSRMGVPRIKGA